MLSSKIRTITISLVAPASFALAALMPAASQAQWHNYCVAGHCYEHANYNYANPCTGAKAAAVLIDPEKIEAIVAAGAAEEAKERERHEKEEEEGKKHQEEIEKSFYGCDGAARISGGSPTIVHLQVVSQHQRHRVAHSKARRHPRSLLRVR